MKKKLLLLLLLVTVTAASFFTAPYLYDNYTNWRVSTELEKGKNPTDIALNVRDEMEVYDEIHRMANSMIVAVDGQVWGTLDVSDERIDRIYVEIHRSDYADKEILLDMMNRWRKEEFSQIVYDHNYVWKKLGGTVGMAVDQKR